MWLDRVDLVVEQVNLGEAGLVGRFERTDSFDKSHSEGIERDTQ